jgi:hypothetical protein
VPGNVDLQSDQDAGLMEEARQPDTLSSRFWNYLIMIFPVVTQLFVYVLAAPLSCRRRHDVI